MDVKKLDMKKKSRHLETSESISSKSKSSFSQYEPDFTDLDAELAKHADYIAANEDRLPVFATCEEASAKLDKLKAKLHRIKTEKAKTARPDIQARLSAITEQNRNLSGEDERISKLRAINEEAREREDMEYSEIQKSIERARSKLATLQQEAKRVKKATEEAKRAVERVNTEFLAQKGILDQMKLEEEQLAELEQKSLDELSSYEQQKIAREREQTVISNAEADLQTKESQLTQYHQMLLQKQQLVQQKRDNIMRIMADNDSIGKKLDAEVTRAEETIKAVSDDSESSELDITSYQRKPSPTSTKRKSVNPFSMFRRTQPLDISSDSNHGMSQKTLELLSDGSDDEIPLRSPTASPLSMSTQKNIPSDDSMSDNEANNRFDELMKRTERNVTPVKEFSPQVSPKARTEISIDAMNAIEMPLVDTTSLRVRIEAQTSGWKNRSAF